MAEFYVDLRDMKFVLFEQIGLEMLLKTERYKELDAEEVEAMVEEAAKVAKELLFPLNSEGDKAGTTYHTDGRVTMPEGFGDAWKRFCEDNWIGMTYNEAFGGMGLPHVMGMACGDFFVGANTSFDLCTMLTTECSHLIENFGTDELKNSYCEKMYTGVWGGTMCLTESQAGTDVGAVKTKAIPNGDGTYKIEGSKIFITFGEHDMTENNVHAVLARVEGDPQGTKGISLFVVPKYRPGPDGGVGEFNDVKCVGIEHKMGIHASPTCTLNFGEDGNCVGWILGEQAKGMRMMFQMMNAARLGVGLQGSATANAAYLVALNYAKERIQGPHISRMKDPTAPKVPIIEHPDIRRMLMLQKAYAEGLRAMLLTAGLYSDLREVADTEEEREKYNGLLEIMTPICKAYGSDMGFRVCEWAVQTLGGYGYTAEYPAEQLLRDVKIASIYEGANGIQALDLVGRKITAKMGANLMSVMAMLNEAITEHKEHPALKTGFERLAGARDALNEVNMFFFTEGQSGNIMVPVLNATPYLELFGDTLLGYYLLEQGVIAHKKLSALLDEKGIDPSKKRKMKKLLAEDAEARFLDGKVKTAQFFCNTVLPLAPGKSAAIRSGDKSPMDIVFDPLE